MLLAASVFGVMKFNDIFSSTTPEIAQTEEPSKEDTDQSAETETEPPTEEKPETEIPEKKEPSLTQPSEPIGPTEGVGTLSWVVNKRRPLNPKTYVPPNLVGPGVKTRAGGTIRADVAAALRQLFVAAKSAGHDPMFSSGYRSYQTQVSVYNSYVASDGQAAADTYSARPGYSEHQTGLAVDVCNAGSCALVQSFGNTSFGKWLAAHAHEHGFTIRYKQGKQHITGYTYEPWHLRYVGKTTAAQLHASGKTLEEHFGLPAAPDYQ